MKYILTGFQLQYAEEIIKQLTDLYPEFACKSVFYIPTKESDNGHKSLNGISYYDRNKMRNAEGICSEELFNFNVEEYMPYYHYYNSLLDRQISGPLSGNVSYRMFLSLISFFNRLLYEQDVDFIISREIPHFGTEFVLYLVAKQRGVKIVMFDFVEHLNRTLPIFDIFDREIENKVSGDFLDESQAVLAKLSRNFDEVQDSTAAPSFDTYERKWSLLSWCKYIARDSYYLIKSNPLSVDMTSLAKYTSHGLQPFRRYEVAYYFFRLRLKSYSLEKYYNSLVSDVKELDMSNAIVFFSHYQPERTTNPDGGLYYDIIYAIKKLKSKLPPNTTIIYKEHPHIFSPTYLRVFRGSLLRDECFYKQLLDLGVKFVSPYENNDVLFRNSKMISSVTGTVLLEAVAKGTEAIMFGNSWHVNLSGLKHLDFVEKIGFSKISSAVDENLISELDIVYRHSIPRVGLFYKNDKTTESEVASLISMLRQQRFI